MIPSLPFAAALAIAAVSTSVAQTASPSAATPNSALGRPRFDANEQGLRVPYAGTVPIYTRGSLKAPPRIFLDFDAPSRLTGVISEGVPNHPVWLSWAMAPRDKGKTRLTLVFRQDTSIAVRVDPIRGHLLIVPRIPAPDGTRPATGPTPLDESLPALPEPTPAARRTATPTAAPTVRPTPTPTPWAPRPAMTPWIPARTPAPLFETPVPLFATPAPRSSDPGMIYLPGSPDPVETPTITISTPTPLPPAPTAPPMRAVGGSDLLATTSMAYGYYEEVPVGTTQAVRADNQRIAGARLASRWWPGGREQVVTDGWLPWWGTGLDLYGANVAYADPAVAGGLHARQEWRSHLALTRGVRLSPLELQGGVGLQGRYETSWTAGMPAAAGAVTMGWRAVLAPEIVVSGRLPLVGGLEVYGEGAVAPFAMVWVPVTAAAPPSLGSNRFEVGLAGTWSGLRLAGGYRRWSLTGAGYGETFQGPVLTLGGWLEPAR